MEYVNIMEAARHLGVSDKTVRRWIHAGKLSAHFPQPNRCEIEISHLEQFMPGHVSGQATEALEGHVAELEQRVLALEQQVQHLLGKQESLPSCRSPKEKERTTGPLPKRLVSLLAFARHHNVAEGKVQTHISIGLLPVKRGKWTERDGTIVTLALDAKGRAAFYQIYHDVPPFMACKQCPHQAT
jgi:excisionase family DNA binding protein